jgi:hypothetical protein
MRVEYALLCLCSIQDVQALKAKKEDKVILSSGGLGALTTLTFYSVHVPEWLTENPKSAGDTDVSGTPAAATALNPVWSDIATEAGIPIGKIDVNQKPDDYKVTFPSILLGSARVRYTTEGSRRIQISCKAAGGQTVVSYKVPKDPSKTEIGDISKLFAPREASPKPTKEAPDFVVEFRDTPDPSDPITQLGKAWLGMQDFCTMLIKLRQLFLNKLRDKMVAKVDLARIKSILKDDKSDLSSYAEVSIRNGDGGQSLTTSAQIFNIGKEQEVKEKVQSEFLPVIKQGRCLGESYRIDPKVLAAQQPVVALVTSPSTSAAITIQCFSFFEGKIVPVVEITQPKDRGACKEGTDGLSANDFESRVDKFIEGFWKGVEHAISGQADESVDIRVIREMTTHGTAEDPAIKEEEANIKALCQRLTQDYLLIVRDDAIKCDDCLFKYNDVSKAVLTERGNSLGKAAGDIVPDEE